jgi:hypothetical protein
VVTIAPGRIRLAPIAEVSAASLYGFINANVAPAATARTDGWQAYPGMPAHCHDPHVIGPHIIGPHIIGPHAIGSIAAHVIPPWVHRVFRNLKTWALGVYRGLRPKHLQSRLDEFVFRFNRRHISHAAFRSLLGIGIRAKPVTHRDVDLTANNGLSCLERTYYRIH